MTDEAAALLGQPVRADGVHLGTVGAVWVDGSDRVLGVEVRGRWSDAPCYVPLAAARVVSDGVEASPLAILGIEPVGFLERRGARRLTTADAR